MLGTEDTSDSDGESREWRSPRQAFATNDGDENIKVFQLVDCYEIDSRVHSDSSSIEYSEYDIEK